MPIISTRDNPRPDPRPSVLPGAPVMPLTDEQRAAALGRLKEQADRRLQMGAQLFEAADQSVSRHAELTKQFRRDHDQFLSQLKSEFAELTTQVSGALTAPSMDAVLQKQDQCLQRIDAIAADVDAQGNKLADIEKGIDHAMANIDDKLQSLEDRLRHLQDRWMQTRTKVNDALAAGEAKLYDGRRRVSNAATRPQPESVAGVDSSLDKTSQNRAQPQSHVDLDVEAQAQTDNDAQTDVAAENQQRPASPVSSSSAHVAATDSDAGSTAAGHAGVEAADNAEGAGDSADASDADTNTDTDAADVNPIAAAERDQLRQHLSSLRKRGSQSARPGKQSNQAAAHADAAADPAGATSSNGQAGADDEEVDDQIVEYTRLLAQMREQRAVDLSASDDTAMAG